MTYEQAVEKLDMTSPITHEKVTPDELINILKDDVIQAAKRPGSWEGDLMLEILQAHGFLEK